MASSINPIYPETGNATTQSVRDNFQSAKDEIESLQGSVASNTSEISSIGARVTQNESDISSNTSSIETINANNVTEENLYKQAKDQEFTVKSATGPLGYSERAVVANVGLGSITLTLPDPSLAPRDSSFNSFRVMNGGDLTGVPGVANKVTVQPPGGSSFLSGETSVEISEFQNYYFSAIRVSGGVDVWAIVKNDADTGGGGGESSVFFDQTYTNFDFNTNPVSIPITDQKNVRIKMYGKIVASPSSFSMFARFNNDATLNAYRMNRQQMIYVGSTITGSNIEGEQAYILSITSGKTWCLCSETDFCTDNFGGIRGFVTRNSSSENLFWGNGRWSNTLADVTSIDIHSSASVQIDEMRIIAEKLS